MAMLYSTKLYSRHR